MHSACILEGDCNWNVGAQLDVLDFGKYSQCLLDDDDNDNNNNNKAFSPKQVGVGT